MVPPQDMPSPDPLNGEENAQHEFESQPVEIPIETEPEKPAAAQEEEPLQARLLRLQADFENFRKRMDREKKDWIAFANERLILELLPVMDHFELGLEDGVKNDAPQAMLASASCTSNCAPPWKKPGWKSFRRRALCLTRTSMKPRQPCRRIRFRKATSWRKSGGGINWATSSSAPHKWLFLPAPPRNKGGPCCDE